MSDRRTKRTMAHLLWVAGSLIIITAVALGLMGGSQAAGLGTGSGWIPTGGETAPALPQMAVLATGDTAVELQAQFSPLAVEPIKVTGGIYSRFTGEGYGTAQTTGLPELAVFRQMVEIPAGSQVQVEVIHASFKDYSLDELGINPPYPLQPPVRKTPTGQEQVFVLDEAFYTSGAQYPASPASAGEPYVMRGRRIVLVEAWPLAYDPAARTLRVYSDVTFRLNLTGGSSSMSLANAVRYSTPAYDNTFARELLNYNLGQAIPDSAREDPQGYMIFTADAYYDAIQPFVALQENYGLDVTVIRMSEVPGSTREAMKAIIADAYANWAVPPAYVLLVGDTNTVPTWPGVEDVPATDLYFVTMDGANDWHPDLGRGRFPVRTVQQAENMVNKYLQYAETTGDEDWVKKISFPATCDNYTIAEGSHNYVINTYTEPKGYWGIFPVNPNPGGDQLYCVSHDASEADVIEAYNDGRKMVIYSGHGNFDGWELLDQSDVPLLGAEGIFPFVASHACMTGDYTQTETFGETWVLQENKGAIAFWGSTTFTYWDEDDVLERAAFDSYFSEPEGSIDVTEMTNYGLLMVEESGTSLDRYYWEEYNILGDPALFIFLTSREPTFSVSPAQTDIEICRPDATVFDVAVTSSQEYSATVTLTTLDLPAGVDASFDPASQPAPFLSTFTLDVGAEAPTGTHAFRFHGEGADGQIKDTPASLTVRDQAPGQETLLAPTDGAVDQSLRPSFSWDDLIEASTYDFQVDDTPYFETPLVNEAGLNTTSFTASEPLQPQSCYWWRAKADNICGAGTWANPFFFSTQAVVFQDDLESGDDLWITGANTGANHWMLIEGGSHSPTHSFSTDDQAATSDTWLRSAGPFIPADGSLLTFWHTFGFEGLNYDGAVLEASVDGGAWGDLGDQILEGGYTGIINTSYGNPLAGRAGWVGDLPDWGQVSVDMSAFAGHEVTVRWRLGTDSSVGDNGWFVDDVMVTGAVDYGEEPALIAISPEEGSNLEETIVVVTGLNFTDTVYLALEGNYLLDATVISPTTIAAIVPPGFPVGTYDLTVYNGDCQVAVLEDAFTVTTELVLSVEILPVGPLGVNQPITFTAEITGVEPFTYTWDFGDGAPVSGEPSPVHAYTNPGLYEVSLEVEDSLGATAEDTLWVLVTAYDVYLPVIYR